MYFNISTTKVHIKDLTTLINESKKKEWIDQICNGETFLFTYNRVKDKNPNLDFNIEKFWQEQDIAIEFIIHTINFKISAKPN